MQTQTSQEFRFFEQACLFQDLDIIVGIDVEGSNFVGSNFPSRDIPALGVHWHYVFKERDVPHAVVQAVHGIPVGALLRRRKNRCKINWAALDYKILLFLLHFSVYLPFLEEKNK